MTPTATPDERPRRSLLTWLLPAIVVLIALVVAVAIVRSSDDPEPTSSGGSTTTEPDAVAVSSDAPSYRTLDELIDASDLVVRARVEATEPGRTFGEGEAAIRSRLVTLEVDEVLRGDTPAGELGTILVEEEGWLEDGSPLIVDGLAPSKVGDDGVWFLVDPGDDTTDSLILVNAQGRYLVAGDGLAGAEGDDPLVAELTKGSVDDLEDQVRSA